MRAGRAGKVVGSVPLSSGTHADSAAPLGRPRLFSGTQGLPFRPRFLGHEGQVRGGLRGAARFAARHAGAGIWAKGREAAINRVQLNSTTLIPTQEGHSSSAWAGPAQKFHESGGVLRGCGFFILFAGRDQYAGAGAHVPLSLLHAIE
ncbi:hypothetical protein NDU88_008606 [Pleurodeles waltl]|uniref:Uncharacterized protein n=1 Tax=Pleurodeles waltl TaxID=8319 RepID=A0AAV7QT86_PLEWA|nr:hypothetical protein NDU88_008606 [Pleurodeles waltl]